MVALGYIDGHPLVAMARLGDSGMLNAIISRISRR